MLNQHDHTSAQMKLARECQKKAYKMAVDDVTTFRDYGVQSALLAIQETEARAQGLVDALWGIIDDIDTASDVAKGYRKIVERLQAKRWETGITTDGQKLIHPSQHGGEREY